MLYALVDGGLKQLNYGHLLFLKRMERIEVFIENTPALCIQKKSKSLTNTTQKIEIITSCFYDKKVEKTDEFLVIQDYRNNSICIAFKVEKKEEKKCFIPVKDAPLFVHFPIIFRTGLHFLIQAPFETNPLRESVSFTDVPSNLDLLNSAFSLFRNSVKTLQKCDSYDVSFLHAMLVNAEMTDTSDASRKKLLELFFSNFTTLLQETKCIPCGSKFISAENLLLPAEPAICDLLDKKDVLSLFQKENLAAKELASEEMSPVRKFLEQRLNAKIIDAETFAFRLKISSDFLKNKPLNWLQNFYVFIQSHHELWDKQHELFYYNLRQFPFIYTSAKTFAAPFDANGNVQVFLSNERFTFLNTIHLDIAEKFNVFWSELGITSPSDFDIILHQTIPELISYADSKPALYYKSFENIFDFYLKADNDTAFNLVKNLSKKPVIRAIDPNGAFLKIIPEKCCYSFNNSNQEGRSYCVDPALVKKLQKINASAMLRLLEDMGVEIPSDTRTNNAGEVAVNDLSDWIPFFSPEVSFVNFKSNESLSMDEKNGADFMGIAQQSAGIHGFFNFDAQDMCYTENSLKEMQDWAESFAYHWLKHRFKCGENGIELNESGYFIIKNSDLATNHVFVCFKPNEMKDYLISPEAVNCLLSRKQIKNKKAIILMDGCGSSAVTIEFIDDFNELLDQFDLVVNSRVLLKKKR